VLLEYAAVYFSVLQCVAACCSDDFWGCVAACCSVLQCVAVTTFERAVARCVGVL